MEYKIINNPQTRFSHIWSDSGFIKQVNMFDKVVVRNRDSVYEGYVALISRKGINVNLGYGDRFFKWYNVKAVKKPISDLKKYAVLWGDGKFIKVFSSEEKAEKYIKIQRKPDDYWSEEVEVD